MEKDILKTVMEELLKEQKKSNELLEEVIDKGKDTQKKVDGFDAMLKKVQVVPPAVDTQPIIKLMERFFVNIKKILEAQPKNVIHQRRFLLFPEDNTGHYYKIIFGRLIPWGIVLILCSYCFNIGQHYLDNLHDETRRQYNFEAYRDAWLRLDSTIGQVGRKKMDEALNAAVKDQELRLKY